MMSAQHTAECTTLATDCKEPLRSRALRDTARSFEMSPQTLEQARDRFAHVASKHFVEPQGKMRNDKSGRQECALYRRC
jgi:hypothetical protein